MVKLLKITSNSDFGVLELENWLGDKENKYSTYKELFDDKELDTIYITHIDNDYNLEIYLDRVTFEECNITQDCMEYIQSLYDYDQSKSENIILID